MEGLLRLRVYEYNKVFGRLCCAFVGRLTGLACVVRGATRRKPGPGQSQPGARHVPKSSRDKIAGARGWRASDF